jgi:hypothetical protein
MQVLSGQDKLGPETYLLTKMRGKRSEGNPSFRRMLGFFGVDAINSLNTAAAEARSGKRLKSVGGDPDLFVFHRRDPSLRFFVEVKLEDRTRRPVYRDRLREQQELLFPLIREHLNCGVRLARVVIDSAG